VIDNKVIRLREWGADEGGRCETSIPFGALLLETHNH